MRRALRDVRPWILMAVVVAAVALAGCSGAEPRQGADLPDYAYRSAQALRGYKLAVANQELLARLPCYCGCGQDPSFKNLKDCFISDGGQFNPHGANCLVCLEQVDDAVAWKDQGLSVKEVRERTDAKYQGRGVPTDTPPVEDSADEGT